MVVRVCRHNRTESPIGGLTTTSSSSAIQFGIENIGGSKARLNAVRVTRDVNDAGRIWKTEGGSQGFGPEITVEGGENDGLKEAGNPNNVKPSDEALYAHGSTLQMDSNGVLATSGESAAATVFIGDFGKAMGNNFNQYDFGGLTRVSADSS